MGRHDLFRQEAAKYAAEKDRKQKLEEIANHLDSNPDLVKSDPILLRLVEQLKSAA